MQIKRIKLFDKDNQLTPDARVFVPLLPTPVTTWEVQTQGPAPERHTVYLFRPGRFDQWPPMVFIDPSAPEWMEKAIGIHFDEQGNRRLKLRASA